MRASLCLDRGALACGLEHSTRAMALGAVVPKFHEDFATALLRSGQLREAEAILNLILSEDDQSPVAWRLYGDLERERGDYNAALRRYRHAAVIGEHVDYEIGRCLLELGDVDAAIERLQRAVDRAGDRAAGPLFHLARARHRKGDIAIAAGLLARARTIVVENNDTALLSKIDHELETLRP